MSNDAMAKAIIHTGPSAAYEAAKIRITELEAKLAELEQQLAELYTLVERTCGDGCHCMAENNGNCALTALQEKQ